MIFYYHFRDTFNVTIKLGCNADKKILSIFSSIRIMAAGFCWDIFPMAVFIGF